MLTARAVCKVSNGYTFRLELCAHPLRLPATIADLVDSRDREPDYALPVQRRKLHRTRGCLLRPGAARGLHTNASRRRALAATPASRLPALQRPERKVQCQVSSFLKPACAHAQVDTPQQWRRCAGQLR